MKVLEYDDVVNKQRCDLSAARRDVLKADVCASIERMVAEVKELVDTHLPAGKNNNRDSSKRRTVPRRADVVPVPGTHHL
jgi:preprotein translocase subunit SecA